ncbi:hypothetical protein ACLBKU_16055 [Erythrobacter sp. NE805]|uniref:hypothetical protein n=1 Tax=Erythrobacter sp. NE805 TaxID=3389875 RepID=UPI00396B0EED
MTEDRGQPTVIVQKGPNSFQSCMGCVGYCVLGLLALFALGSLTRCDENEDTLPAAEGSQEQMSEGWGTPEATASATTERPILAGGEYNPSLALRGIDPQWSDEPLSTRSNYTSNLGLLRVNHTWRNTSLDVDFTDAGGVYMIQVRSGLPGRCNSGPDLASAFDQYAHDLGLGAGAAQVRPKLLEAWASKDRWSEADIGKVMVRATGGCPRALVLKAL